MSDFRSFINLRMILCAIAAGGIVGISIVIFFKLFALVHNIFFLGQMSFLYDEKLHTNPSWLGFGIIITPVVGSLIVTWIIQRFATNERGLSVPEIIYSIHLNEGKIQPVAAIAKAFASIISIGSGGSLGREGPIMQLSAALSSIIGHITHLTPSQKVVLIAAGSAAGTAIAFNAPIGSIVFVIEILLARIHVPSVILIIIAEIIALVIKGYFLADLSYFKIINLHLTTIQTTSYMNLLLYTPLGVLIGMLSIVFIRGIYFTEDRFVQFFKNPYLRHAIGMLFVGIMIYALMYHFGHYYIEGIGFATINDALNYVIKNPWLLITILICKLLSTFLTLGSGSSGGIFSPSLFIGAVIGALWSIFASHYFPTSDLNSFSFVIAGMAGMLGSVTGGIITAIVLCIEITNDYQNIIPILLTVTAAYITRKVVCDDSVYTLKLTRRKVELNNMINN